LLAAAEIFEAASDCTMQKIIMSSSGDTVFGLAQGLPLAEDHATNPISPSGVTKLAIENYGHLCHWE
jgi:UDP-glucose 4-epimerase